MRNHAKLLPLAFFIIFNLFISHSLASPLPVEHFANSPDVKGVQLSPSGKKILAIIRVDSGETQGSAVQVTDLATNEQKIVLFSDNTKYFLLSAEWKDNKTILATSFYPSKRDTWMGAGQFRQKTRELRLLIINTETGSVAAPFSTSYLKRYRILPSNLATVISRLKDDPDHILMSVPGAHPRGLDYPIVVKVNIKNQKIKLIQDSKPRIVGWGTDLNGKVRVALHQDEEKVSIKIRDANSKKWKTRWVYDIFSQDEVSILGFDKNPNIVFISAYHNGFQAVFKVDLRDKKLTKQLVHAVPGYDINGFLVYSPNDSRVIGIGHTGEGGIIFIDPEYKQLQASIDKAIPSAQNFIYSLSDDETQFLVNTSGPTESGTYYLGTHTPLKLKAVAYHYKNLLPNLLGKVEKIHYKTRDGIPIEAFLTLPPNSDGKNLPTIMFPHGGPVARDYSGFDTYAQFFASRGYAVLQMNFRGSSGYGFEFRNAGLKKWGKEMQDDIEDGAVFLANKGIANPDKIAIAGISYGGYASLMGIVKTPDRYRCAISVNGVSDVYKLVKNSRNSANSFNYIDEMIGNNNKALRDISPVNFAEQIKVPVLLIHGELDRQVPVEHSRDMFAALKQAEKQVEYIEQPEEDHYLWNEARRVQAFTAIDTFLQNCLPVN